MAENNTKKHKLSIYLIKEAYTDNSIILPDLDSMRSYPIGDGAGSLGTLYVKTGYRTVPKWADLFRDIFQPEDINLETKSARAVLIANVDGRKFCLTFGHAHFLLESLSIVRNFGLRVALNIGGESSLRAVDKTSLDVVGIQSKEQSSKESSIGNFGFDFEIDILKSITAKSEDGFATLSGRDSVSINTAVSLETLRELLTGHLEKYNSDEYRAKFPWVDNISPERDRGVIDSLNNILLEKVEGLDSAVWLAIPEIILWEDTSGFAYKKRKNPAVSPDIRLSVWKDEIVKRNDEVNIDYLKRKKILLYDVESRIFKSWSVFQCLNAEVDFEGNKYILNDTDWYLIDADFVESVNSFYDGIEESNIDLPPYQMMNEPEYNRFVSQNNPDEFDLLDRKMIHIGGGRSSIEFCDLYTKDKQLIHVKKYGGSSVLSHLFQQGVVSGELFISDSNFRSMVNERLGEGFQLGDVDSRPDPTEFEVCFAIMSHVPGDLSIPFFSKVVMKNAVRRLQTYGYSVTKKKISFD